MAGNIPGTSSAKVSSDRETSVSALSLASSSEGESFVTAQGSENGQRRIDVKGKARAVDGYGEGDDTKGHRTPRSKSAATPSSWIPAKSWVHFAAGGLGGMCGAIVTAPFDVVKTRLQSDVYAKSKSSALAAGRTLGSSGAVGATSSSGFFQGTRRLLYHFVETGILLRDIGRQEGIPALFRGLGPTLVGVIPARSINFFSYGNGKQIYARAFNGGQESASIHLVAAATAGIITATATNPIWVVKTRLQLQDTVAKAGTTTATGAPPPAKTGSAATKASARTAASGTAGFSTSAAARQTPLTASFDRSFSPALSHAHQRMAGSMHCIAHIWRHEGIRGFYRGLSASYLGVTEGTIQWTLYEQFKSYRRKNGMMKEENWADKVGAAGAAKLIATIITYPHEVVRTRLRQAPPHGSTVPKYTGLVQSFNLVLKEEGIAALYGGLSPHLLRVVPNAAVMYSIYELVLKYWS